MNNIALIVTALGGLLTGVGGLILGSKAQKRTEKIQHAATLLEGYDEITGNLQRENASLYARVHGLETDLDTARTERDNYRLEAARYKAGLSE